MVFLEQIWNFDVLVLFCNKFFKALWCLLQWAIVRLFAKSAIQWILALSYPIPVHCIVNVAHTVFILLQEFFIHLLFNLFRHVFSINSDRSWGVLRGFTIKTQTIRHNLIGELLVYFIEIVLIGHFLRQLRHNLNSKIFIINQGIICYQLFT